MIASWSTIRKQVLKRDNYTCLDCKSTDRVEVHHIQAREHGGGDDPSNLKTLCFTCHKTLHAEETRQRFAEQDRIGWAQYEAMKQCQRDYIAQTGGIPQLDEAYAEFSRNWPGWANVPQY